MSMKKKKAEPMKNPTPVKSPARKNNPTGTDKSGGTILVRARAYFIPEKKV